MSTYLTVLTAQADADRRSAELLRDLEAMRRTGLVSPRRPSGHRLLARLLRRPVPAC